MRVISVFLGCLLGVTAFAGDGGKVSLGEVAENAVGQSKLTLPGSCPSILKRKLLSRQTRVPNTRLRSMNTGSRHRSGGVPLWHLDSPKP